MSWYNIWFIIYLVVGDAIIVTFLMWCLYKFIEPYTMEYHDKETQKYWEKLNSYVKKI